MGTEMLAAYEEAASYGGIAAKVKLAMLTKMGSAQAELLPDSPENLRVFSAAMDTIRHEFQGKFRPPMDSLVPSDEYTDAYRALMNRRMALLADPAKAYQEITEVAAKTLHVERASVWFYDSAKTLIRCVNLYSQKTKSHSSGVELKAADFSPYFKALETEKTIAADDAHTDPRTSAFSAPYLTPLGINSMLDVPIWTFGRMHGVLCHEHTGPKRHWHHAEEEFAYQLGSIVGLIAQR